MAITDTVKKFINRKRYQKYRYFFETDEGKSILTDMCRAHNVFNGGFDPDPYEHAFAAGERNTVLRILTILNLTPQEVADLDRED